MESPRRESARGGTAGETASRWAGEIGGRKLLEDPAERARVAEVKLADALAVLDVQKATGPGSLTNAEKFLAGQAAGAMYPAISSPPWLRRS